MKRHEYHLIKQIKRHSLIALFGVIGLFTTTAVYLSLTKGNESKDNEAYWLREGYTLNGLYHPAKMNDSNALILADGTATSSNYKDTLRVDSSSTRGRKPSRNLLDKVNPKAGK